MSMTASNEPADVEMRIAQRDRARHAGSVDGKGVGETGSSSFRPVAPQGAGFEVERRTSSASHRWQVTAAASAPGISPTPSTFLQPRLSALETLPWSWPDFRARFSIVRIASSNCLGGLLIVCAKAQSHPQRGSVQPIRDHMRHAWRSRCASRKRQARSPARRAVSLPASRSATCRPGRPECSPRA
jgi:hypothetical protein